MSKQRRVKVGYYDPNNQTTGYDFIDVQKGSESAEASTWCTNKGYEHRYTSFA